MRKGYFHLVLVILFAALGPSVSAQNDRPTFYPHHTRPEPIAPLPPEPDYPVPYGPDSNYSVPGAQEFLTPNLLSGDPIALLPIAIRFANRYGILQCVSIIAIVFFFQYLRTAQKNTAAREEFFRRQLDYSDERTTGELGKLSAKLSGIDQDFRTLQDQLDRHAELIRANGELSREIVATMTAHNFAVEKGIGELSQKIDLVSSSLQKKRSTRKS